MDRTIWKNSVKELSAYDILYIERIYPCIFAEFLFGKWFIPWLSERNVTQPLKEVVEKKYTYVMRTILKLTAKRHETRFAFECTRVQEYDVANKTLPRWC